MARLSRLVFGLALLSGCVDIGNDVGYRLPASVAGAGAGSGGAAGSAGAPNAAGSLGAPETTLPPLPVLSGVEASVSGDSVSIRFEPLEDAVDYRVYELPANEDVTIEGGDVTIRNATYRCAGNRQAPFVTVDGAEQVASGYMRTLVDGQDVGGYIRTLDEATLGHAYAEPGRDRVPVYALGDSDPLGRFQIDPALGDKYALGRDRYELNLV